MMQVSLIPWLQALQSRALDTVNPVFNHPGDIFISNTFGGGGGLFCGHAAEDQKQIQTSSTWTNHPGSVLS